MRDHEKISQLIAFSQDKYSNIPLDDLTVYAVAQLSKMEANLSFENAVAASFRLFPSKFSLMGFPEYPDSDRARNCLNRCTLKSRQSLGGKALHGFILNEKSKKIAEQVEKILTGKISSKSKASSLTRRRDVILAELKKSIAFQKFTLATKQTITESEVCFALQGTLDSSPDVLRENFNAFVSYANEAEDAEVLDFLSWAANNFKAFLGYRAAQ